MAKRTPSDRRHSQARADNVVPDGYLRISSAVDRLREGMFGGLRRPKPVEEIKLVHRALRVRFGPWRERSARAVWQAAIEGKITVCLCWTPSTGQKANIAHIEKVPPEIIRQFIRVRGGIPDHPYRISQAILRSVRERPKLMAALLAGMQEADKAGIFVVNKGEFNAWYRSERKRQRWPSQRLGQKIKGGRPSKKTEQLKSAVVAAVHDGTWSSNQSVASLRRILLEKLDAVPSHDTLARCVDDLCLETGDPALRRKRRRLVDGRTEIDFRRIAEEALARAEMLVPSWIPDGRRIGRDWIPRNPRRADRSAGSFRIDLHSGKWLDHASGDRGGDLIALWAYLAGVSQSEAAQLRSTSETGAG